MRENLARITFLFLIQVTTMKKHCVKVVILKAKDSVGRRRRACAPQSRHRGDAGVSNEGWARNIVAPNVDLSFSESD